MCKYTLNMTSTTSIDTSQNVVLPHVSLQLWFRKSRPLQPVRVDIRGEEQTSQDVVVSVPRRHDGVKKR